MSSRLTAALRRVIALEALDWVRSLSPRVFDEKERERAEILASDEYDVSEYAARIIVADKARQVLRAVSRAIRTGEIGPQFDRDDRLGLLITTGLRRYDPRIAFQASLRTAYAAGREDRIAADDSLTHKVFRTMRDSRVRDTHRLLDGVCLPKGDPFWDTHSTPLDWRCRCKTYGVDAQGIERLRRAGVKLQMQAPKEPTVTYRNKATGEEETLPASVGPGWGHLKTSEAGKRSMARMLEARMRVLLEADEEAL